MITNEVTNYFNEHGYVIIDSFLQKDMADLLYEYSKSKARRELLKEAFNPELYDKKYDGQFVDEQAPGAYSLYGDPLMDVILQNAGNFVSGVIEKELVPTYSYWRLYVTDNVLKKHKDRPSCEYSTTLCLGYDISNIKDKSYNWPMWIDETGSTTESGKPIHMEPGDMIVYKGSEVDHWRLAFEGRNHAQVFMHYNNKNGPFAKYTKYDGRPFVALPSVFRNQQLVNKANDLIEMKNNNDTKDTSTENK